MERLTYVCEDGTVLFHPEDLPEDEGVTITDLAKERKYDVLEQIAERLANREQAEEQGLLLKRPCKVGDTVFVDSKTIPTKNMEFEEVKEAPLFFEAKVVSFRQNFNGNYIKLKVKAKWLHEWVDPDCGPDSAYFETEKYFTYPLSAIGKTVFLTKEEAEQKLGTVEELLEARGKQIPKKLEIGNDNGRERKCCGNCGCFILPASRYCSKCGQAIDWSDKDE